MHVFSCLQLHSSQTRVHSHKYYACVHEYYGLSVFCIFANFMRTLGLTDFLHLCQFYLHSQGPYVTCIHTSIVVIHI